MYIPELYKNENPEEMVNLIQKHKYQLSLIGGIDEERKTEFVTVLY